MKTICAWCKIKMTGPDDGPVSHGICKPCMDDLLAKTPMKARPSLIRSGPLIDRKILPSVSACAAAKEASRESAGPPQ